MDFSLEYSEEQEEFAKEVCQWLDKNVPDDLVRLREPCKLSFDEWLRRRELGRKLGEKGWLYPGYPREYGGGGLDGDHNTVLHREMAERNLGLPPFYDSGRLALAAIIACGTDEQKQRFLPPILKGEVHTWQLFTEPEAGTDEANQQTNALRATREGEYFVVNGGKIFVGGLPSKPDQFLLLTRSDLEAPRHQNLAMFIAPANLPGIDIQPLDLFPSALFSQIYGTDIDAAPGVKHSVFFDDVRIHESYLLGGDRDGWRVANATLTVEHGEGGESVVRNLIAEKLLEQCKSNPEVVKRLQENPRVVDTMVDVYINAQIERLFSTRNAWITGTRQRVPYTGPQLTVHTKLFGSRLARAMAEILGPYAYIEGPEWGLENDLFEVPQRSGVCLAPGGTPEALKIIISRALSIGR